MNWRILPREDLINIFKQIKQDKLSTKDKLLDDKLNNIGKNITPTDVRKAITIFIKSNVLKRIDFEPISNEAIWGVGDKPLSVSEMLMARDIAIVSRILNSCNEENIPFESDIIQKLLYTSDHSDKMKLIVQVASKN